MSPNLIRSEWRNENSYREWTEEDNNVNIVSYIKFSKSIKRMSKKNKFKEC